MIPLVKRMIAKGLSLFDYEITKIPSNSDIKEISSPVDAIYSQKNIVFHVDIGICFSRFQFCYSQKGWHPFVKTVAQYIYNENITYENSILKIYYDEFQPESILNAFFEFQKKDFELENSKIASVSPKYALYLPWSDEEANNEYWVPNHGYQHFGPISLKKGEEEFSRLIKVYKSIKNNGYRPGGKNGEIDGYFLKWGNDYRFIIETGKHRSAVLSAMGYSSLRVTFKKNWPRVIDIQDVQSWPQVKNGHWDPKRSEIVFLRFFQEKGFKKACNIGIIQKILQKIIE